MDEFDVAKFLEDESLLSELIEDIQEQLQTPFVETRLSNGFKENLSDELADLINQVEIREEQISMLLQLFYSLTEVGVVKIKEVDDDFYALEEDIQNMKLEHEAMQSQYQKIRNQTHVLKMKNEKNEEDVEQIQRLCTKLRGDLKLRRAEIDELISAEKMAAENKVSSPSKIVLDNQHSPSKSREMEAREYETKNFVLEKEGWLLAEELNRLKLKKEQEDYYRELFEETSNELSEVRAAFDEDIPEYECSIKSLKEECEELQRELLKIGLESGVDPLKKKRFSKKEHPSKSQAAITEEEENFIDEDKTPKEKHRSLTNKKSDSIIFIEKADTRSDASENDLFLAKEMEEDIEALKGISMINERSMPLDIADVQGEKKNQPLSKQSRLRTKHLSYEDASVFLLPKLSPSTRDSSVTDTFSENVQMPGAHTQIQKATVATQTVLSVFSNSPKSKMNTTSLEKGNLSPGSLIQVRKARKVGLEHTDVFKEFFILTCQCVKMNSPHFLEITNLPTTHYYQQIQDENIPYYKWYQWIKLKLEKQVVSKRKTGLFQKIFKK